MTTMSNHSSLFFDITDIVDYAKSNDNVTGIQRVQVRIISHLANIYGEHIIFCSYWNKNKKQYSYAPASDVFPDGEFNPKLILATLDFHQPRWPIDSLDVKKHLNQNKLRGLPRAKRKLELYIKAAILPDLLNKYGIRPTEKGKLRKSKALHTIKAIPKNGVLIFLGANWFEETLTKIGTEHKKQGGEVVQMIYDLIPTLHPEYCTSRLTHDFNNFIRGVNQYATKYACISDCTAKDLHNFLQQEDQHQKLNIKTIPLAHEFIGYERNSTEAQPSNHELLPLKNQPGFVLCVGTIEIRKNGANLLRAYLKVLKNNPNAPKLVFAGKPGWKTDEFYKIIQDNPDIQEKLIIAKSATDGDLAFLYQNCLFTVYPSFYEGWGLPVGESAWFGKLCVASNATSLPEVCGESIDYVDPTDIDGMAEKIEQLIAKPDLISAWETKIKGRQLRTWADVSEDFYSFATGGS